MNWINRMILQGALLKMDGEPGGAGGGPGGAPAAPTQQEYDALKAELAALKAKAPSTPPPNEDPDLQKKALEAKAENEKKQKNMKDLEKSLEFTMGSKTWLAANEGMLPANVKGIFEAAEKESYADGIKKASAIKSGLIQEFFTQQENLDLLTASQKNVLAEYLKLTKDVKEERASDIYDTLFEPTFEMLKRVKRAQQINNGFDTSSDAQTAYKNKMMELSRKHYLGEK